MKRTSVTESYSLACSLCRLRSHALHKPSPHSLPPAGEVIPHYYGTDKKESSKRTAQSMYGEAHAGNGAGTSTTQSGRLRQSGVDGQQLRRGASINLLCWAAAAGVGLCCTLSICRAGDYTGESVGEEEAGRLRGVTGGGIEAGWRAYNEAQDESWGDASSTTSSASWVSGGRGLPTIQHYLP